MVEDGVGQAISAEPRSTSRRGAVEISAAVLIGLAWPALLLPFGLVLWLGLGVVGLVLVWASAIWTLRRKLVATGVVVAAYLLVFLVTFPTSVACTTGSTPQACPSGAPAPVETSIP